MGCCHSAAADETNGQEKLPAFDEGEKLTYSLGWQFIVVGHATLEVLPDEEMYGRPVRSFQMTAKTGKVVSSLFKVNDTTLCIDGVRCEPLAMEAILNVENLMDTLNVLVEKAHLKIDEEYKDIVRYRHILEDEKSIYCGPLRLSTPPINRMNPS